jgi:hypothetical protein
MVRFGFMLLLYVSCSLRFGGRFCFQLKQLRSTIRLMTFTGTSMLVKPITEVKLDKPISLPEVKKSNNHWAAERR